MKMAMFWPVWMFTEKRQKDRKRSLQNSNKIVGYRNRDYNQQTDN